MNLLNPKKQILVENPRGLYKWAKIFNRLQRNFFVNSPNKLRREKQIEDFITLNGFRHVRFKIDTDLFDSFEFDRVQHSNQADLVVITDQKFSRFPCPVIIKLIKQQLDKCPNLYLCLNRHYINIDNSYHDYELDSKFTLAITQWLKKNLPDHDVIDLSLDYVDYGRHFTWAVPDRHYFIRKLNAQHY
jgi:hypothetical protein